MLKIAICDDCEKDALELERMLYAIEQAWNEEFQIYLFYSGSALCDSLQEKSYDILFLDILMRQPDGIETARRIRGTGADCRIIFVSCYDKRLRELFSFRTIGFVDKPIMRKTIESALKEAYQSLVEDHDKIFSFQMNKTCNYLPLKELYFVESERHLVALHTQKDVIRYNDRLKNVWRVLIRHDEFVMPHKSYIVNLRHAVLQNAMVFVPYYKLSIPIGRTFKEETVNRYMIYLRRRSV